MAPTGRDQPVLARGGKSGGHSAAAPTSATTMNPTNAGDVAKFSAAFCTDSTNTSLTSATSTVTPASVGSASVDGQGFAASGRHVIPR